MDWKCAGGSCFAGKTLGDNGAKISGWYSEN